MTDQNVWPPLLMAGPIVRRSDETAIHLWLATSTAAEVRATISRADLRRPGQPTYLPKPLGQGKASTLELGAHLHVALVAVRPASGEAFPTGVALAYDLLVIPAVVPGKKSQPGPRRLRDLAPDLAYPEFGLPTVVLPTTSGPTNLLHGSCRKLHGASEDLLQVADHLLAASIKAGKVDTRPTALLLTGDQIYADDVADELIDHIIAHGQKLLGFAETIPRGDAAGVTAVRDVPKGIRSQLVKSFFTPDDPDKPKKSTARNHMLGFGEFCFLYLLSLHEAHWPAGAGLSKELEAARKALPSVRRALANIPTYMICDDHDITDDWNLHGSWHARAYGPENGSGRGPYRTGRRVLANGLAAYWAFQAWGDDPEKFAPLARTAVGHVAAARRQANGPYPRQDVVDGNSFETAFLNRHWDFVAPTLPPTVFVDSRTRRGFGGDGDAKPPKLVDQEGIEALGKLLGDQETHGRPLLVVTASPLFGHPDAEDAQRMVKYRYPFSVEKKADLEFWRANHEGFSLMVAVLAMKAPDGCVILSGDVHFAFAAVAKVIGSPGTANLFQFTSSALKNHYLPGDAVKGFLEAAAPKPPRLVVEDITLPNVKGFGLKATSRVKQFESKMQLYDGNNLGQLVIDGSRLSMLFHTDATGSGPKSPMRLDYDLRRPQL